jgi:hypothetical protein
MTEPLLPTHFVFQPETYEAMRSRYDGFGLDVFEAMKSSMPSVFEALRFYRESSHQPSDVYAVCHWNQTSFAIQLDPDCEVICLWDRSIQTEIGTWESDPASAALDFIQAHFTTKGEAL